MIYNTHNVRLITLFINAQDLEFHVIIVMLSRRHPRKIALEIQNKKKTYDLRKKEILKMNGLLAYEINNETFT